MAPVIQGAQDGNAVLQSGCVCLCAGQNMCVCAAVFVRLGRDVCIHMVMWQHIRIVLAVSQLNVIAMILCVCVFLYEPFLTFCVFFCIWSSQDANLGHITSGWSCDNVVSLYQAAKGVC